MNGIILTQNSTPIIGQIAWLLGKIMEGIFTVLDALNIPNVGLSIILFTVIVNLLMLPLTIKQQKFAKLSAKMNPEIQAIQAKYKNKKDQDSMMAQNQEIQALYAKYGVSPTGSCMYLLIQMPILLALYRVIDSMPAYVGKIKEAFQPLVDNIIALKGAPEFVQNMTNSARYMNQFSNASYVNGNTTYIQNTLIDCLNKASSADFTSIAEKFPSLATDVANTVSKLDVYNNFLGLNIGNSPLYIMKEAYGNITASGFTTGALLMILGALAIPVLSVLTQWINIKLMPQQNSGNKDGSQNDQAEMMAQSMKTMNLVMPLFSAYLCFSFPSGMGIYWVAGSVVRSIQQVVINRHIDKMDFDDIIRKNAEKSEKSLAKNAKKMEKFKEQQEKINAYANMSTKNMQTEMQKRDMSRKANINSHGEGGGLREEDITGSDVFDETMDPNSIMAKANLVKKYNTKSKR